MLPDQLCKMRIDYMWVVNYYFVVERKMRECLLLLLLVAIDTCDDRSRSHMLF